MLLADEFFCLSHHDRTGKPRLSGRATSLGLAAGLLGELSLAGKLSSQGGLLYVLDREAPEDALIHTIVDQLASEPEHRSIRTWLAFLSQTSYEAVAQRLQRAGYVRPQVSRRMLKQVVTYVPLDGNAAAMPWARLSTTLHRQEPMDVPDVFLAGLATATGMQGHIIPDPTDGSLSYLRYVVGVLPTSLRELLLHTEAAVGEAVMTHRT